jgi:hypothetical protein
MPESSSLRARKIEVRNVGSKGGDGIALATPATPALTQDSTQLRSKDLHLTIGVGIARSDINQCLILSTELIVQPHY